MIRAVRLAPSRPMYAFNPATWRERYAGSFEVDAVWFRRKKGVLSAVTGTYHPFVQPFADAPTGGAYESWIAAANDNRYGGKWSAIWNGQGLLCYSTPTSPESMRLYLDFLKPMLDGYPDPPADYDGWWTFEKAGS